MSIRVRVQATQNNAFSMSLVGGKIVVMHVANGQTTALETNVDTYSDGMWHYVTVTKAARKLVLLHSASCSSITSSSGSGSGVLETNVDAYSDGM